MEIFRHFSVNPERLQKERRNLLVRIIVPETEEARDKIIKATNSQTPIPKSSLRVTDPIHRQIEDYLKTRDLYYDRRKNYYKNEGKKPKDIISVSFLAQCLMSVLMQRPDSARARPSTLLEDNSAYKKLYHKNNDLVTYYLLAYGGRKAEISLKEKGFSPSLVTNLKFYVVYAVFVLATETLYPTNKKIFDLDIEDLSDDLITQCIELTRGIFDRLGATDKVAKGSEFLEKLKSELEIIIDANSNLEGCHKSG
ncbi:AIPR family protein [Paenibacillus ihbetae]|nr:AIPR family protein [Paenibacillus ihbetae]